MTVPPLQDLIAAARRGDLDAYGQVVSQCQGMVRGFIAMLGVRLDAVDDVAQETFLSAMRSLGTYDDQQPFDRWLRGVARNQARAWFKRSGRRSAARLSLDEALLAAPVPEEPLPETDRIQGCLDILGDRARRLVRRHYWDQQAMASIADDEGMRPDAVRVAIHRAREALRRCLTREDPA